MAQMTSSFFPARLLPLTGASSKKCLLFGSNKAVVTNTCMKLSFSSSSATSGSSHHWAHFPMGPPDPIVGLNEAFAKDAFPQKVNVGLGAYRSDDGKPHVLPVVRQAEKKLLEKGLTYEYLGIVGDPLFIKLALKFVYGDDFPTFENRVAGVQTLSGTGGLRVFGELLAKFGHKHIYVPNPTWGNHIPIFTCSGMEVRKYRYYDTDKSSVDFDGLLKDLSDAPNGSAVLLHACAHNPTGMDPSMEQWEQISKVMLQKKMLPFFDCAYQGFASGNAPKDAAAIRLFVNDGHHLAVVQSFSKNFGLYGQRVGALSVVTGSDHEAQAVLSQLKIVIRSNYSNPPRFGAAIVSEILSDPQMTDEFIAQCEAMATRIGTMRQQLRRNLEQVAPQRPWSHITQQIGMFAYSGLSKQECEALRDKHHIYCTLDGRISMAGVTSGNVQYLADSIGDVIQ